MMQGEIAADMIRDNDAVDRNQDGKIQYVLLEGETGHQDAIIRTDSVVKTIKEQGIILERLSFQFANWNRGQAENKMTQLINQYGDEITIVPFSYSFSAYDRELAAIENHTWEPTEEGADATANPAHHLNNDDISEDYYEGGNWIESSASISEDGTLVFRFCVYMCNWDSDYTRIEASYSPIN